MTGNRLWVIIASAVIVGVLALGWMLGVSPLLLQASSADEQRLQVEAQNYGYEAQLVELKALGEKLPELEQELAMLRSSVPETVELDDFFDSVAALAAASGVLIETITASEAAPYGAEAASTEDAPGASAGVFTVPVSLTIKGPQEASVAFVAAMQNAPRLFLVTSVDVTAGTDPGGTLTGYLYVIPADVPSEPQPAG